MSSGRYIKIAINDSGPGISEDLRMKIFDPYFTTKPAATGLGLAISYSVVKKHGGLLLLESSSDEGSTFAIYLRASDSVAAAGTEARESGRPFRYNHQRILVMDDEEAIRELTSQLLGTLGYEVTAVPDGLEAVRTHERALRRRALQAVILDATVRGGMGGVARSNASVDGPEGERNHLQRLFR